MRHPVRLEAIVAAAALLTAALLPGSRSSLAPVQPEPNTETSVDAVRGTPQQPGGCCGATGANVPKVGGDYGDQDYSSLTQITPRNVSGLAGTFVDPLQGGAEPQESTPVEVDGRLYLQTSQGSILAVDAVSGQVLWDYHSGGVSQRERGVAVGEGRVYASLAGEQVVALDQQTGRLLWRSQVGTAGQDVAANGSETPWTLYYNGLVFVGTANGGAAGMRGHLYALNASDGTAAWNFAGTAGPGQPGAHTWAGDSWQLGGGDTWMAPAIDPALGLIYLTVANPQPRTAGAARAGDDLYTNSLVALRWDTGTLVWWFQSVHHDLWDYDNTMSPVIADLPYNGATQKVVIYGSKTGWLYYLNAATGKPVIPVHEEPVPALASQATSPTQPIPEGDPLVPTCPTARAPTQAIPDYTSGCEFTPYLHQPVLVTPGGGGGANWALMSLDQQNGLLYVAASEKDSAYSDGRPYGQPTFWFPAGELAGGMLDAVDPTTNTIVWQVATADGLSAGDGIVTTATGLLFEGSPDGVLSARSVSTGQVLWTWPTGAGVTSSPITYAVNGRQYVAVVSGGDSPPRGYLSVFTLGGTMSRVPAAGSSASRVPVTGTTVTGRTVNDTVLLGRTWHTGTNTPGPRENLASEAAMAPAIMTVPPGTTVTFTNPLGNTHAHCAESFFDPTSFTIGPLEPGQSASYQFRKQGTYFFNDCAGFPWNTGEIIVG
ncbi:MAG: hypothetical protein QOJ73_2104 [Streptosporangiaceae bacterium]|jgi:PQQ-dependent dehydrogenase (methanol/ethanol family)|nr:hypothetical protein [Streptosporangiaceae bacterium]